ncbi:catalase [Aminipila butyrica]|uniref:catalase n=1 Tax=Aminipila butyrica TaxID=433296 RepID=A0A858BV65_9FIRM|nr:catalase [Aminipila butyrica]QIB69487.1 catalase [Aminipila butyrica]
MTDFLLFNKLAEMNRNMTPERLFHEKGVGAYGEFSLYMPFSDYTEATFLKDTEQTTEVFVRFSRALGRRGSAETARDIRGMSVKFYTEAGDYDLLCQNMPVFFINEAKKFPRLYEALRPRNGLSHDKESFWQFVAENPEALHLILWLYSNKGTIKSYRHMEAFSVHTYRWRNEKGKAFYVRYHWLPLGGTKNISAHEAEFLAGYDPDALTSDLYRAIEEGRYPEYELVVQIIPEHAAREFPFDIFNKTFVWPERSYPHVKVGRLTLNRLPSDFHQEVEMCYFSPSNRVPGIELPEDELLALMCFALDDEWRNRRR